MIKNQNNQHLTRILVFLLAWVVFGAALLIYSNKGDYVLWANLHQTPPFNLIFYLITQLGNGWTIAVLTIVLLFIKLEYFYKIAIVLLFTDIFVLLGKFVLFTEFLRPVMFFQDQGININPVPYTSLNHFYSFPSGHTAAAFAFFISLSILFSQRWLFAVCLIIATLVAYSRIYLGQHFLIDVYAGAIIGATTSLSILGLFDRKHWLSGRKTNRSLISLFHKA